MIVHHIGFACSNIAEGLRWVRQIYTVTKVSDTVFDPRQNASLCIIETLNGITIELVSGHVVASLLDRGITLYHVAYAVDDIARSLAELVDQGAEKVSDPTPAILFDGRLVCFLRTPLGLIELVENARVAGIAGLAPAFAICSSFTAAPVEEPLHDWFEQLGWSFDVRLAPPGQVVQALVDPGSVISENTSGLNIVLVRPEDLPEGASRELAASLAEVSRQRPIPYVVCLCPGERQEAAELELRSLLDPLAGIHFIPASELLAKYPVEQWSDPYSDKLAQIPYTPELFVALATVLVRQAHLLLNAPRKAIVLDCDNTLWKGVCGEDGPLGIELDAPRLALQHFMRAQHDAGRLLCLSSKNNETDVLEVFRARPEMPLTLECFVSRRINWDRKSENIRAMSDELRLAQDAFVFIDDNPIEAAEVAAECPGVLSFALPENVADIPAFLEHLWVLDQGKATAEDRMRTVTYHAERVREQARSSAPSFLDFLAGLQLEIHFAEMDAGNIARIAQLTQRTTQFNTSARKRTESELQSLHQRGEIRGLAAHLRDRFGDYGLVGAVLYRLGADALKVDTFLLSCRAFGKDLEHHMLARTGDIARQSGLPAVEIDWIPTERNGVAATFLDAVAAPYQTSLDHGRRYRIPVDAATKVRVSARTHPNIHDEVVLT